MIRPPYRSEGGYVLVTALIALAVMSLLAIAAISQANTALRMSRQVVREEQALYMANAGVEFIYARLTAIPPELVEEGKEYTHTMQLDSRVEGRYVVTAEVGESTILTIRSTGYISEDGGQPTSHVVTAEFPLGEGGGSGETPSPELDQLVIGNGPLAFLNNANICGDIIANGDLTLGNNVIVWAETNQENSASPCDSILGEGRAVASGNLIKGNNTVIQGGWCDSDNYVAGTPCNGVKPQVQSMAPPDFPALKEAADVLYVQSAADCSGRPNCQTFSSPLTLAGDLTYPDQLIYVDGDLTTTGPNNPITIAGNVTFAVTGSVMIKSDITCTGGSTCNVTLLAGGDIDMHQSVAKLQTTLFTTGKLSTGNAVEIHGLLSAGILGFGNTITLYPTYSWPVGVPGGPEPDPGDSTSGVFSRWSQ